MVQKDAVGNGEEGCIVKGNHELIIGGGHAELVPIIKHNVRVRPPDELDPAIHDAKDAARVGT